ncbi:30S ribosomal protein S7 [Candidatus Woesearchaeota archaeon]|nr:30S ribosomal protein S7 [Candidatus Woesearchaeota archaeon]
MTQVLAFNKWDCSGIKVQDPGLVRYINVNPVIVPKTGARYAGSRFHKSKLFIVERLINRVMNPGHKGKKHFRTSYYCTGKGITAAKLVEDALKIIESRTKKNPVEVLVKAIENAAPREEIITIEYGGARYPKAVEVSPQRRVDVALKFFVQGAYHKAFNTRNSAEETLAKEIISAYNMSAESLAISKKFEVERQADASR